jgi:hypothetical protein
MIIACPGGIATVDVQREMSEMKPGERPPASPSNDGRWILDGAALIQKADWEIVTTRDEAGAWP